MNRWVQRSIFGAIVGTALYAVFGRRSSPLSVMKTRKQLTPMRKFAAKYYTVPTTPRQVKWIVIHTIESPEDKNRAYNTAQWTFAGANARQASTHYLVDSDEVVQAVDEANIAWGAEGANQQGIHVEHAGMAGQSATGWQDEYSVNMLERSAELVAGVAKRFGIPIRHITWQEFKAGEAGILGHVDVNRARRNGGALGPDDHYDPGPNFPWEWYLERVKWYAAQDGNPNLA